MRKLIFILTLSLALGAGVAKAQTPDSSDMGIESTVPTEDVTELVDDLPKPGFLPGNPLYFMQNIGEGLSGLFSFGNVKKVKREIRMAERRVAEAKVLVENERYDLAESTIRRYRRIMDNVEDRVNEMKEDGKDVDGVAKQLAESTLKHQGVFAEIYNRVPDEAKAGVMRAMEASRRGHEMAVSSVSDEGRPDLQDLISERRRFLDNKLESLRQEGVPIPEIPVSEIGPADSTSTLPATSSEDRVSPPGPPPSSLSPSQAQ